MPFSLNNIGYNLIKPKFCLYILLAAFSLSSYGQPGDSWYLSKVLNDNTGLPQNSVRSMYFDKATGFLWMTTEAGLVRYDGANTRVFDLRDLPSLKSIRMSNFFSTLQGDVLGCNRLGEIFAIKNNYPVNMYGSVINNVSTDFYYRKRNARSIKNLNFENDVHNRFINKDWFSSNSLWLNDSEWLGISEHFIGFYKSEKLVHQWPEEKMDTLALIARNGFVYAMHNDASGYCINLSDKTLVNINANGKALIEGNPVLFYDNQNDQPLLLNKNNLYTLEFEGNNVSAKFMATLKNLPTDIASVILHPNKRFIFVSTNTTGVYIYHLSPFRIYSSGSNSELNNNYATVLTDSNHIFTCRSLLFDLNTGNSRKIAVPIGYPLSIGLDASNNVWGAGESSLLSFPVNKPEKINRYRLADNFLVTCFLAHDGKFWISTSKFFGYKDNNEIRECITYDSTSSTPFSFLTETPGGRLAGINKKGIYLIDLSLKKFILVLSPSQVSDVRNMNIDSVGLWWITTYGKGIFLYDQKANKLIKFPVDDRGYLLYSHACIDDGHGNFLVPTNKGLFRLSKNNLLQIYHTPSTPLYYQYFDVSSGLLTNEFNGGCQPAFNRMPGGDIILPALQGLVRVKTNELPDPSEYPLFVDFIETKRDKYKPRDEIHFKEDERTQSWHLSFSQWDQPNSEDIFYQADGDTLWQRLPEGEKKIQLNELTGGSHLLKIKYQYGLLQDQFSLHQFKFYIPKKYYEQVWFWPFVFVLFAVMILLIIRVRMLRQALKLQTIRNNISADMHDEIGSTLSSISFYSQALLMQTTDEKHKNVLEKIKENAQHVQEGLSDIVWSVKASMDEMENVFSRMQRFGAELLESKDIYFHFEADEKLNHKKMGMASRKNFYLIFKEAVNNAAKYAQCKNIWLKIETMDQHLRMSVKDDGKGFDVQHAKNGNGLSNMQNRATQMKGHLSIDSVSGQGTTITLVF